MIAGYMHTCSKKHVWYEWTFLKPKPPCPYCQSTAKWESTGNTVPITRYGQDLYNFTEKELSMNTAILELTLPEAGLLSNLLYVSMQATGKAFNEHPLPVQQLSHKIATVYLALEKAEPTSVLDILKGVSDATEQPSLPDNT